MGSKLQQRQRPVQKIIRLFEEDGPAQVKQASAPDLKILDGETGLHVGIGTELPFDSSDVDIWEFHNRI